MWYPVLISHQRGLIPEFWWLRQYCHHQQLLLHWAVVSHAFYFLDVMIMTKSSSILGLLQIYFEHCYSTICAYIYIYIHTHTHTHNRYNIFKSIMTNINMKKSRMLFYHIIGMRDDCRLLEINEIFYIFHPIWQTLFYRRIISKLTMDKKNFKDEN